MAQKFISFYFLDWSKDGDYFSTKIHRVYSRDNQFNDIATQDVYIKEHNLSKRTALQLDKVTEVEQVLVDIPVFYVKYGTTYYFLSYSEGNKLIDSLLTINDYKNKYIQSSISHPYGAFICPKYNYIGR